MDIAIVHYNTPELTAALVRSICKNTRDARILVFDNSDHRPFAAPDGCAVEVVDNTHGQKVDFDRWLAAHPRKLPTACNWGSEKHILSVQWIWDYLRRPFLLLDSDVLARCDLSPLADPSVAWVGHIERHPEFWFQSQRLFPFCLWINVPMCDAAGVRFAREVYIYNGSHHGAPPFYDTGGNLLRECRERGLQGRETLWQSWVVHFGAASHHREQDAALLWLNENRELYL